MSESNKRAFITGGGGYVGCNLTRYLERQGYDVIAADIKFLSKEEGFESRAQKIKLDIRDAAAVYRAMGDARPDVVFHIASYGMSGREQLNRKLIEEVNIQGTKNILEGCVRHSISCLVYTSTYNVIFGGQVIENGDESLPYIPDSKHVDHYSKTKCIAEQIVMTANGSSLKGGGELKVCALRLAGIYGAGEQRHLPRIVELIQGGLYFCTVGSSVSKVEFLHIDNLVQAHHLAAETLMKPNSPAAGEVYNISDGKPINNFKFFQTLVEGLGYRQPNLNIPVWLMYYFAYLVELVHAIVGRYIYNFQPLMTRAEVYKVGVTHYFKMDKARNELGYFPQDRDLKDVVKWFKERGYGRRHAKRSACLTLIWKVLFVMLFVTVLLSFLPLAW